MSSLPLSSAGSDQGYDMKELSTEYIYYLDLQRLTDVQDVWHLFDLPVFQRQLTSGDQAVDEFRLLPVPLKRNTGISSSGFLSLNLAKSTQYCPHRASPGGYS